jgi:hypothetical protein
MKVDRILQLKLPEEKPFPCRLYNPGISHKKQKLPYLWLKYYNQCNKSNTDKLPQYLAKELHLKCFDHLPNQVNSDDANEYPYGCSSFYKVIYLVKQYRKEDDIDDIDDANIKKTVDGEKKQKK